MGERGGVEKGRKEVLSILISNKIICDLRVVISSYYSWNDVISLNIFFTVLVYQKNFNHTKNRKKNSGTSNSRKRDLI